MSLVSDICDTRMVPREGDPTPSDSDGALLLSLSISLRFYDAKCAHVGLYLIVLPSNERAGLHFDCVVESSGSVGGLEFAAEIVRGQKL